MRLLLAEDDQALRSVLVRGLSEEGYVVDAVANGEAALALARRHDYAAAILDWRMPILSGIDVVNALRRDKRPLPVLMLTARDTTADRVTGLDAGADDYLVKPFDIAELFARLRALLRRPPRTGDLVLTCGRLTYDVARHDVAVGETQLSLTATERGILELLLRRMPTTVTRRDIADHVWDDVLDPIGSNTIDVHMARLRAKLSGSGMRVVTVRGTGFRAEPT